MNCFNCYTDFHPTHSKRPKNGAAEKSPAIQGLLLICYPSFTFFNLISDIVTFFQEIISSVLRKDNHIPFMEMPFPIPLGHFLAIKILVPSEVSFGV